MHLFKIFNNSWLVFILLFPMQYGYNALIYKTLELEECEFSFYHSVFTYTFS